MSHQMGLGTSILIGQCAESKQTTYNSTGLAKPARHYVHCYASQHCNPA